MVGALLGLGTGVVNNAWAQKREKEARQQNYYFNELSAKNADKRTRALYNDFYSPSAQLKQLKAAGLSPSVFFGGQGASGMSVTPNGAEGNGTTGISPNMHFIDPLTAAQIENINADTAQKKENTVNLSLVNDIKVIEQNLLQQEFEFLNSWYFNTDNGDGYSLHEIANNCDNFEDFLKSVREADKRTGGSGYFNTKQNNLLQEFYNTTKRLNTEINELNFNTDNAKFNKSIVNALENIDYANLNAEQVKGQLNATIEQANLDEEQKKAWNKVINGIENENARAAIIVISMILDRMASVYRTTPNITMNKNRQIRSNE